MRPVVAMLPLAALVACTAASGRPPDAGAPEAVVSEPTEAPELAPDPVEEPTPPATYPAPRLSWLWYHSLPDRLSGGLLGASAGSVAHTDIEGDPRRLVAALEAPGLELRSESFRGEMPGDELWSVELTTQVVDAPIVLTRAFEDHVYVGWRTPTGYELHALRGSGERIWDMNTTIAELPEGSGGELQLRAAAERVVVGIRLASAAFHDEIDPKTGAIVARGTFAEALLHDRFEWPPSAPHASPGQRLGHAWDLAAGTLSIRARGKALVAERSGEGPGWTTQLDEASGAWANHAAVLEHEGAIHVVAYHRIASGASRYTLASEDGSLVGSGSPGSIGTIGHSKYSNEVALSLGEDGVVFAWGHESGGDYVGTLDGATGQLLGCEVWR